MIHTSSVSAPVRTSPQPLDKRDDLKSIDDVACQLAIKLGASTPHFTTQWMMQHLKLPHRIVEEILWELKDDKLMEIMRQVGPLSYQYRITHAGLEFANRLSTLCGYEGATPVSLDDYIEAVNRQLGMRSHTTLEQVQRATSELVLPEETLEIATLALRSNRSLFLFGPSGNGKSSLGRVLHRANYHTIWIPFAIAVDNQIIRLFDPQFHKEVPVDAADDYDARWIQIEQPFVVSGGELTMDQLDLVLDRSVNYYEAPPHLKANCGTYFIDDLGRQRVPAFDLLNRWIIPLEHQVDYLSLVNGKKIEVPFKIMLVVATNLETSEIADAAFLRRMGYRIHLNAPTEAAFREILSRQASRLGLDLADDLQDACIRRYREEQRSWRASEAKELLDRCLDVIQLRSLPPVVTRPVLDTAWRGYFSADALAVR